MPKSKLPPITHEMLERPNPWVYTQQFEDSGYRCNDDFWPAELLYEAAREQRCRPYKLPLKFVDMSASMKGWAHQGRIADFAFGVRRVMRADLRIPIILSPVGSVMDGFHRLAKAVALGETHVLAVRLKELPPARKDREDDD